MKAQFLVEQIKDHYNNNSYKKTIKLINRYLDDNYGMVDWLFDIYLNCQIRLGKIEEAKKNLKLMTNIFPDYYNPLDLALKYIKCHQTDKLNDVLLNNKFSTNELFDIARACFYQTEHEKAEWLFNICLSRSDDDRLRKKALEYLQKIKNYRKQKDFFVETSYSNFKFLNQKLNPGHVVYVDRLRDKYIENTLNQDPLKSNRPYMIWKIVDNKIYAFPVTSVKKTTNDKYILFHQNYSCCNFDRKLKDRLVCLEERDVQKIIDKIEQNDYEKIIESMYYSLCFCDEPLKEESRYFVESFAQSIIVNKYDVVRMRDPKTKTIRFFYVLDTDKKYYKVVELDSSDNDNIKLKSDQILEFSNKTPILNSIKSEENEKVKKLCYINESNE